MRREREREKVKKNYTMFKSMALKLRLCPTARNSDLSNSPSIFIASLMSNFSVAFFVRRSAVGGLSRSYVGGWRVALLPDRPIRPRPKPPPLLLRLLHARRLVRLGDCGDGQLYVYDLRRSTSWFESKNCQIRSRSKCQSIAFFGLPILSLSHRTWVPLDYYLLDQANHQWSTKLLKIHLSFSSWCLGSRVPGASSF